MWKIKISKKLPNPSKNHKNGLPEVDNWVVSKFILDKLVPIVGTHPYPLSELQLLVDSVLWVNPKQIFEWGTHIGVAARIFSETLTQFGIDGKVYSIDLPDNVDHVEHPHNMRGILVKNNSNVVLIQGDGINSSKKILKRQKGENTLFFLDGDHSYESVSRELIEIGKHFPKAAILGHDTFYQVKSSSYNIGPYKAFKEFVNKYSGKYIKIETSFGLPGMTLLIPKK